MTTISTKALPKCKKAGNCQSLGGSWKEVHQGKEPHTGHTALPMPYIYMHNYKNQDSSRALLVSVSYRYPTAFMQFYNKQMAHA